MAKETQWAIGALVAGVAFTAFLLVVDRNTVQPASAEFAAASPWTPASQKGDLVVFEATVEALPDPPTDLPSDFAMGFEEHRERRTGRSSSADTWSVAKAYTPSFLGKVEGLGTVSVDWSSGGGFGSSQFPGHPRYFDYKTMPDVRAVGLAAGDRIACLGKVVNLSPRAVSANSWGCYGGSLAQLRAYPAKLEGALFVIAALIFSISALLAAGLYLIGKLRAKYWKK